MSLVPALDLREIPADPRDAIETVPANIEAEQALLGAVLYDKLALDALTADVGPHHFYEPFHQRLWLSLTSAIRAGLGADPIILAEEFRGDKAFAQFGGTRYLADLVDRAPPAANADGYAQQIVEMANLRTLLALGEEIVASARGQLRDPDTGARAPAARIIEEAERRLLTVQVRQGSRGEEVLDIGDAAMGVLAYVDDLSQAVGSRSGLGPIDLQLGPMMDGDMIVLGGRPSMGKSALALGIGFNIAAPAVSDHINDREYDGRPPKGVIEIHAEMDVNRKSGGQVARRHLADVGYGMFGREFPTYKAMRDKTVTVDQRAMMAVAAGNLRDVPIRAIKRTGITLSTLRSICRRQIAAWARVGIEPGLLILDHAGLVKPDGRTSGRYEAQTDVAIGCKELCGELGLPGLILVQLSRSIEQRDDKRPILSDLRDSGAWEENADIAAFVYRDAYYAQREKEPDQSALDKWASWDQRKRSKIIEVIMGKVREGGAGSNAEIWGDLAWNAIRSTEPEQRGGLL